MCLAPCYAGCTKEEYDAEAARVLAALASSGASLEAELEKERETASAALDFERAAALHKKIEKAAGILRGLPQLARRVDALNAVVLQRAAEENAVAVFAVRKGLIAEPLILRFGELSAQPRSVEMILRQHLELPASPRDAEESLLSRFGLRENPDALADHLALLARWYYSKPSDGEIFFAEPDWHYRRILRACARLLAPQPAPPSVPQP